MKYAFIVLTVFGIFSVYYSGRVGGYCQGQIDALNGKWKYEIKNVTQVVEVK